VPRVWTDNRGASTLSYNPIFIDAPNTLGAGITLRGECVEEGDISVHWVPGEEDPADVLTKPVAGARLSTLKQLAGMTSAMGLTE